MDYRGIPAADWERPPLAMLAKLKFDFRNKPFAIAPAVHFLMGGIRTDPQTQTQMPGLFACGEVAWGLHGANRRGGNALAECVVFGQIAGTQAARWASTHPMSRPPRRWRRLRTTEHLAVHPP
jgi:succinate dehydrogenase/fumarate reductase flavoprotein subunit